VKYFLFTHVNLAQLAERWLGSNPGAGESPRLTTCSIDIDFTTVCLDSNIGYLVHEYIALPTKLQEYLEYFIRTQDTNYIDFQNHADFSSP